jgi:hypothetical protein
MPRRRGPRQSANGTPEVITREQAMFRQRLAGKSLRNIAADFGCELEEVQKIVAGMCTGITNRIKLHTIELELERLDELQAAFHEKAKAGDPQCAAIVLRIQERRAALLGLDTPTKIDAIQIAIATAPAPTGIERIRAAIERVARQGNGAVPGQAAETNGPHE